MATNTDKGQGAIGQIVTGWRTIFDALTLRVDLRIPRIGRGDGPAVRRAPTMLWPDGIGGRWGEPPAAAITATPDLYVQSEAVFAAVNAYANRTSSTPFMLNQEDADGALALVRVHPALTLLRNPNPFLSRTRLLWHVASDLLLSGNAYWFMAGPNRGKPTEIWRLNPRRTRVVLDNQKYIGGYVTEVDNQIVPLDASEVIHFKRPNPYDDHDLYGLPVLAAAALAARTGRKMAEWNRNMFGANHAVPAGIVSFDDWLDDETFAKAQADWRATYGDGSKRTAFLRGGKMQFQSIGLSQTDVDFLAGAKWEAEKVYRTFGTYHLLPAENSDDRKVNERMFLEEYAWPFLVEMAETVTDHLLTFYGPREGKGRLELEFEDIRPRERALELEESREEAKGLTLNEWRAKRGLEPLDGGDDVLFVHVQGGQLVEFEREAIPQPPVSETVTPAAQPVQVQESAVRPAAEPEDAQERAERRESANDDTGDDIGGSTDKTAPVDRAAVLRELNQWQKFALARIGTDARPFKTDVIPPVLAEPVQARLFGAETADDVRQVFEAVRVALDPDSSGSRVPPVAPALATETRVPLVEPAIQTLQREQEATLARLLEADAFDTDDAPGDIRAYVRLFTLLPAPDLSDGEADDLPSLHSLLWKRYAAHNTQRAGGSTGLDTIASNYHTTLYEMVVKAFDVDSDTGLPAINKADMLRQGRRTIEIYFRSA